MKKSERLPDADDLIEVYNDTGIESDPLGMYTGIPYESVPADRPKREPPRYDTQAVRYCSGGKRYLKPEKTARPTQDADDL